MKYAKIFNKKHINIGKIHEFVELVEKEKELELKNVVTYEKYISNDKYFIMVMKKYENKLERLLYEKDLTEIEKNELMIKLLKIIKELEEKVILNNNIKMSNILLDDNGEVMIIDNLKHLLIKERYKEDFCNLNLEILRKEELSEKSEMWNIGMIYCQLLSKETPFIVQSLFNMTEAKIELEYKMNNDSIPERYNNIISKLLTVE